MISYAQALKTMLDVVQPLAAEELPLTDARGRILAAPLVAPHDMPPFDQSMVDGYALRSADVRMAGRERPVQLPIGQTITAGERLQQPLPPRHAVRIMTGAPMPAGANAVVKLEESHIEAGVLTLWQPLPAGTAMQRRGAELRRQTVVLRQGDHLTPQRIGTALALGLSTARVVRQPCVALMAPGNELLPPGAPLQPGKKWCSNLYALTLRVGEVGGVSRNLGIVPDTLEALTARLRAGLDAHVAVILGASGRGDHDFATRAMHEVGAELLFRGVATSPGRSVTVARHQKTLLVGLPGSPWAAFLGFEVFVLPVLRALLGQQPLRPPSRLAVLAADVQSPPGVTHFVPVRLSQRADQWLATPLSTPMALVRAESGPVGCLAIPPARRRLRAGTQIRVSLISY